MIAPARIKMPPAATPNVTDSSRKMNPSTAAASGSIAETMAVRTAPIRPRAYIRKKNAPAEASLMPTSGPHSATPEGTSQCPTTFA